ncbi:MAG: exonuclease domain-containing protein [Candidatus Shikimatogenerans sp. JK-2022]|nr:exonuclease domain-containing protein [Candidatus Shikimatogenerans bostrichidophilus]
MFLFIDTETTGLPINNIFDKKYIFKWPRLIQFSWIMYNKFGKLINSSNFYIKLNKNYNISLSAFNIHGINKKFLKKYGTNINKVLKKFFFFFKKSGYFNWS